MTSSTSMPEQPIYSHSLKLEEETRLRREVMKRVIESRGEKVPKEKTLKQLQKEEKTG